ncbi:hypothetical protein MMB75_01020 [Paenibacillus sp. P2(2022)]|uniref:hypothetical protein n=1 Tax=Paenibacillus TaxID=44249 RepID=UPI0002F6F924|nr:MULTISPECIES: hypothetical protein [Paenibacillus]AUS27911.1 hypothetical protein C1A50_3747 [Paenibacillus polymyxa]KJK31237.1 hypothetical protein TY89_07525 [Paenibacillus polymyxa]KKD55106.1 hypothetical protein C400_09425 [Paenibacillus sp. ICGEB2008]MDG0052244.1 hypothetical protein [Paenibacillus sp. P2(2022)]NMP11349.1 hypothetical protein [Paenibacillus polymyxa]
MSKGSVFVSGACTTLLLAVILGCTPHADPASPSGASNEEPKQSAASATSTQHTQQSKEELVLSFYKDSSLSDEAKVRHITDHLAGIHWGKMNEISEHQSMEIIDYLYKQRALVPSESFPNVIKGTAGLDGALTEEYDNLMEDLFTRDKTTMIRALADMDKTNRVQGIGGIGYALSYRDPKEVKKEIQQWQAGQQLTTAEKDVIRALFAKLDNPY